MGKKIIDIKKKVLICSIGVSFLLCFIPFYNVVLKGIYSWHISQPEVWQGTLEIALYVLFVLFFTKKAKQKFVSILFFMGALYLSVSGVIIPALISALYLECIFFIGHANLILNNTEKDIIKQFVSGISIWLFVAILCSAAGFGTINHLRIATVLLVILALYVTRKEKYITIGQRICSYIQKNSNSQIFIYIATISIFFILMLFAKTNRAIDHDSLWYGLKSEYVLVGEKSFYDYLGLSSFVFYYPKLLELFFLPISDLGDYSVIISGNICLLIVIAIVLHKILKKLLNDLSESYILLIILTIITIPSVANIAATAKADTLGLLFVLMALNFLIEYFKYHNEKTFVYFLCCLFMCTGSKLTYLPWGGLLFLFGVSYMVFYNFKKNKKFFIQLSKIGVDGWLVGITTLVGMIGIHFRTFLLTGYPFYPTGLSLWNKLGFTAKNFMESDRSHIQASSNTQYLKRIYEVIFDNSNLEHMIMQWPSNVTLFLIIYLAMLVFIGKKKLKVDKKLLLICILESCVAIYYLLKMDLPDSNYFNFQICLVIIFSISLIYSSQQNKKILRKDLVICLSIFIIFQSCFSIMTHFSWSYGTHKFDDEIIKNNFETDEWNREILNQNGIGNICLYLEENQDNRVITTFNDYQIVGRLKSWIQIENDLNSFYSNKKILNSYGEFIEYIKYANINAFIVSKDNESVLSDYIEQMIEEYGYDVIIDDQNAVYYEINNMN